MFVIPRIKHGMKRKISLILKAVILSACSENHLPENYLWSLLEMLLIPGLSARSTEPESREMKFRTCFTTYIVTDASLVWTTFRITLLKANL